MKVFTGNALSSEYLQIQNNENPEYELNHKTCRLWGRTNMCVYEEGYKKAKSSSSTINI